MEVMWAIQMWKTARNSVILGIHAEQLKEQSLKKIPPEKVSVYNNVGYCNTVTGFPGDQNQIGIHW